MRKGWTVFWLLLTVAWLGLTWRVKTLPPKGDEDFLPSVGSAAADFVLEDVDGNEISLSDFRGKTVILNFWATWHGQCVAELPNLHNAYSKYHESGLDIISINLDQDKAALTEFIKENKMPWTQIYAAEPPGLILPALYGVRAIPHMVLIGRDGKIAEIGIRGDALEKAAAEAIAVK